MNRLTVGSAALALFVLLCVLYEFAAGSLTVTSDQTSVLLQAHSMASGNVLLGGWHVPSDNFLTLTLAVYTVAERIAGFSITLIHVVPPLLYAVMVALVVLMTVSGLPWRAAVVAGALTLLLIGFPSATGPVPGVGVMLTEHVETIAAVAGAWLLFNAGFDPVTGRVRPGAGRLALAVLSCIVLLAAAMADPFTIFLLVLPAMVLAGAEWARRRAVRYHVTLALWAVGGAVLGTLLSAAVAHLGGFAEVRLALHPVALSQIGPNLKTFFMYLVQVTGADVFAPGLGALQLVFSAIRLAALVFTAYAVLRTLAGWIFRSERDSTAVLLSLAVVIMAAAIIVSQEFTTGAQRYLEVLAVIAAPVAGLRAAAMVTSRPRPVWQPAAPLVLLAIACIGSMVPALTTTVATPYPTLATWLQQRGLTAGVGDYWYAAMVQAQSGGAVTVLPVFEYQNTIVPQTLLADSAWLHQDPPPAQQWFALWPATSPLGGVDAKSTQRAFGAPTASYSVDGFVIAVWDQDIVSDVASVYASAPPGSIPPEPSGATSAAS